MLKILPLLAVLSVTPGVPCGTAVSGDSPLRIPAEVDESVYPLRDTTATIEVSGVRSIITKSANVRFNGKGVILIGEPKKKPLEIEIGYGAVDKKPVLSVSVYSPISSAGKVSRTRIDRPTFAKTYTAKAKAEGHDISVFLSNWEGYCRSEIEVNEKALKQEYRNPFTDGGELVERIKSSNTAIRVRWSKKAKDAVKAGEAVRERLEWIEATDKLLAEIEQKAMLNYKITAKDGNKVVVVGQSK